MAVTDVSEVKNRESGGLAPGNITYTRFFRVTCAVTDTIPTILTASFGGVTIPVRGEVHPDDGNAYCTHVGECEAVGDTRTLWEVPVKYSTYDLGEHADDNPRQANPLNDPARHSWGVRFQEVVVAKDIDGNPIDNSANTPLDPPLMEDEAILTLRLRRNEATYSPAEALSYANSTNSSGCTISGLVLSTRQARCRGIPADDATRNGIDYFQVTYEFEFKLDTWQREVLDIGMYWLDGGDPRPFLDANKAPMQTPQLLDGAGGEGSVPVFLPFNTKKEKNFGALGLGSV